MMNVLMSFVVWLQDRLQDLQRLLASWVERNQRSDARQADQSERYDHLNALGMRASDMKAFVPQVEILQPEWTIEDILSQQEELAKRVNMTVTKVYEAIDRGDFHGTILQSRLHMLRFLLGDEPQPQRCSYSHIPTCAEDMYSDCKAIAEYTCCDFGGPVCKEHKCRCSKSL